MGLLSPSIWPTIQQPHRTSPSRTPDDGEGKSGAHGGGDDEGELHLLRCSFFLRPSVRLESSSASRRLIQRSHTHVCCS
uniref:Uncharacterized protein n=1 Tax=Oryza rufipogon TaxID=4529 RepID=A0A0E0RC28_ORYRU